MRAIILAAGFGARMRPLTNKTPKALIPISGRPLLLILLQKLQNAGFDEIAVNSHYKAEELNEFVQQYEEKTKSKIYLSFEQEILNTGGGIKKMLNYFSGDDPVLVHNVDILSAISFKDMLAYHLDNGADCTMAVNKYDSDRFLCFDAMMNFKGRYSAGSSENGNKYNFCGIQVVQPSLFREISEKVFYSIDAYINALNNERKIIGFEIGKTYWRDIGRVEDIEKANNDIKKGLLAFDDQV